MVTYHNRYFNLFKVSKKYFKCLVCPKVEVHTGLLLPPAVISPSVEVLIPWRKHEYHGATPVLKGNYLVNRTKIGPQKWVLPTPFHTFLLLTSRC